MFNQDLNMMNQAPEIPLIYSTNMNSELPKKRRLEENYNQNNIPNSLGSGKRFLPIPGDSTVFHSEVIKPKGETLYHSLEEDILVNLKNIEQISFAEGIYFIGDNSERYLRSEQGSVINFWRYSEKERSLYISRSFLFTNPFTFIHVRNILQQQ